MFVVIFCVVGTEPVPFPADWLVSVYNFRGVFGLAYFKGDAAEGYGYEVAVVYCCDKANWA